MKAHARAQRRRAEALDRDEILFDGGLRMPARLFDALYDYQKTGNGAQSPTHNKGRERLEAERGIEKMRRQGRRK